MRKKNSSTLTLQAKFQLKIYFYSCYELLELVILGNHLLLTWASFRGELLPKFTLYDYFEWIWCPENSRSAKFGHEFTHKILSIWDPTNTKQDWRYLLSVLTSILIKYRAGKQSKDHVLSGSHEAKDTRIGFLSCKKED